MTSSSGGSRVGTRFGPYELRSLIGVGGMGEVYRAYDTVRGRMVALKLLRPELAADPNFQERFRRESRLAARLQEPHVIPVHDFGDIDGVLYIDMRLVDGASLKDILRSSGPLEPARAAAIIKQVAAALDAAHADGLIHRDIKPENVLLTADDFAYLVDFGIAHAGGDAGVTRTGMLIGSSAYMAPERFANGRVGPAADIYSLTCLLYECLTGRPPFDTGDLQQLMSAHMFAPPPRPSTVRRGLDRGFDDVIATGMAKQPEARFATAGQLAAAATAAAEAHATPAAPGPSPAPAPTLQFTQPYPPDATGYTPYPPEQSAFGQTPPGTSRRATGGSRLTRAQQVVVAAVIVLFGVAAGLAAVLVSDRDGPAPSSQLAVPPAQTTEPTGTTAAPTTGPTRSSTPTTPTTRTTPTTTTSPERTSPVPSASPATPPATPPTSPTSPVTSPVTPAAVPGADRQGFIGHAARCDSGSTPAAMVRTDNSLAVVCETRSGDYYYRGERLSDGASIELRNARPAGDGFDAVNPADGTRYEVRPDRLTIISNGRIDANEPVQQYAGR